MLKTQAWVWVWKMKQPQTISQAWVFFGAENDQFPILNKKHRCVKWPFSAPKKTQAWEMACGCFIFQTQTQAWVFNIFSCVCFTKWKMTIFLLKSMKLTLEVFFGYSYEMAYFHPNILIEAILIKKKRVSNYLITYLHFH